MGENVQEIKKNPFASFDGKKLIKESLFFITLVFCCIAVPAHADPNKEKQIVHWIDQFQPSVLSRSAIEKEFAWFRETAKPFSGKKIRSVAEDIKTHFWERDVLAKAFYDITGITVEHEIIGEGAVVESLLTQMRTGKNTYDIYVNDADMVGTHLRVQGVVNLTDYMKGEGKRFTNPNLKLEDFLNLEFGQDYQGNQLQLPDQQFANLYWFRHDWFQRKDIKKQFLAFTEKKYGKGNGYQLGVPINWSAYEDIVEFFY